jgi:hypothetical protein
MFSNFGRVGYMHETDVPQWIRDRMAVLNIAEEGALIERVGARWHETQRLEDRGLARNGYRVKELMPGRENRWYVLDVLAT